MSNGASTSLQVLTGQTALASLSVGDPRFCLIPDRITYPSASSFIRPDAPFKIALKNTADRIQNAPPGEQLLVVGHTDDIGSPSGNDPLSERRAQCALAVLQGNPAMWETIFTTERGSASGPWGNDNFREMLTEVNGTAPSQSDIDQHRAANAAGAALRATLFAAYFTKLLGRTPSTLTVTPLPPGFLGCGQNHILGAGHHEPSRRVEFFFFRGTATSLDCSLYPTWLTPCVLIPTGPITVTIAPIDRVRVGATESVLVTVSQSPLPLGATLTLEISITAGAGAAEFVTGGGTRLEINRTTSVRLRGVRESDRIDNLRMTAVITGQPAVLAQEDFTVVRAFSFFLKFEIWNLGTGNFDPLAGQRVRMMDANVLFSDTLMAEGTCDAQGRVLFTFDDLTAAADGEMEPDIYLAAQLSGTIAGHSDLPDEWSTRGWKAIDGTPGYHPDFTGIGLGTPAAPLVFRVGVDFHVRLQYPVAGGARSGSTDPAAPGIPVDFWAGGRPGRRRGQFRTDENGEVHGVIFDISGGDEVHFHTKFEMEDAAINLPRARVHMSQSGWRTFWSDADRLSFPSDETSIGTQSSPQLLTATENERNVALYFLKVLREWSVFLFQMTGGDWTGINNLVMFRRSLSGVAYSWPVGEVNFPPSSHWSRDTIAHELSHQIMWKEVNFSSLGIAYEGIFGSLALYHRSNLLDNPEHALIEGWAEFIENILDSGRTPPYHVLTVVDSFSGGTSLPLGPPPNNRGESVEGAVANGLWAIFQNHVAVVPRANIPETVNGDVLATSAGPWLTSSAARDRFLTMIWQPFKDLAAHSSPTSTHLFEHIRSRNSGNWHELQPELQKFNMAMAAPSVISAFPHWGPLSGGAAIGLTLTVGGDNFIARVSGTAGSSSIALETQVSFGGATATPVTVSASNSLTVAPPPQAPAGTVDVVVTTPAGSATLHAGFTYIDEPLLLNNVIPGRVSTQGGDLISLTGTGFLPGAIVSIDGNALPVTAVQITSPGDIIAELPARGPGLATVTVQNPDATFSIWPGTLEFITPPQIFSIFPPSGPATGGTLVDVFGSGFDPASSVVLDTMTLANVVQLTSGHLQFTTPAGAAGTCVTGEVINPDGFSDTFEFCFD
ncbi:OmpA family protein [Geoalkalibacter ferrihydriticus]|uniref:OmpA-like domain-containing protein n=2 Tax=Geoalkalibacter ferrihydriticus TaxID=392333 RepID=A0A0C2HJ42_9BACT|nr:IPT/TIG domain-containing protein [Geoalkalibacter ferrihydriticus]KIH77071.1 hypothetical protein GFER_08545 [Geoalkalibacter ferrihydriticus DSM 17813]SDL36061.1 OmpA family protein [Geoalkalibacter ferrihydriticus]